MRVCRILLLLVLMSFWVTADEAVRVVPEGKTANYLKLLLKRPRPGYLFDRFLNSWLESGDLRSLELYLETSDEEMAPALLAFYNEAIGEAALAAALYDEMIEANPMWVELLYYKASVDAQAGAYDSAVDGLEALLSKKPDEELELKSLKLLGRALLRSNREQEGLAAWERLLNATQMDPDVAEELLEMQLAEGLYEEALANCDRVLIATKDPYREVMLRMRRASILVRMERRNEAVKGLREAFALTGEGSWLRRDVISRIETLYQGEDDLPGLRDCLDDMLMEWPGNPSLLKACAETARLSGREDAAIESARELVRIMPDARETKDWYVALLLEIGRYEEAIATIAGFVDRYPDDNTLRARLADVNHRAGDDEQAVKWILEYLERSDQTEADYLDVARTLARYDLNEEATSVYLEMLTKWPNSAMGREAVATHMSRESYLHLNLAWKHYEWLAQECDSETLTRLSTVLLAANSPLKARDLLLMRHDDFTGDYRYLSALFEATSAMKEPAGLLELGAERVAAAATIEELELATAALVYEIKKNNATAEWIDKLSAESDPAINDFWLLVALYVVANDSPAADRLIVKALERAPSDETLLRCRLSLAKRTRDWETAETVLIQLIEANPTRRAIWIRELVPVLTRAGRTDEALEWIETWKTASPNATRPYELERDALLAANRPDEAIEGMRAATRRFDESIELKLALGRLYESRGRPADAQRLYWRMLNAEETLDGRMARLGDLIRSQQNSNLNKLIRALEIRAENAPTSPFPLLGLAECYRVNHRANERAEVLERVLELRPNDVSVLRAKAALEEDLGDYAAARELMLRVAELDPSSGAYAKLVEFEALYGDPIVARMMMQDPRIAADLDAFVLLASRLIGVGCLDAVSEPLARLAAERPADYRLAFLLGCHLQEIGRPSAAAQVFIPLLNIEEERPGAGTGSGWSAFAPVNSSRGRSSSYQNQQRMVANWRIQYGAWVSDELLEAYSCAMYGGGNVNYYRGYPVPRSVSVPDSLEELEPSIRVKLNELMPDMPEEERVELAACLDEGVPYIRLTSIRSPRGVNSEEWWNAAEELYPDDEQIRLLRALTASHTIQSEEELKEVITSFADDYPELALNMLSRSVHRFQNVMSMLPRIVGNMEITDDNLVLLTQFSVSALQTVSATNTEYQAVIDLFENVEAWNLADDELDANTRLMLAVSRARLDEDYTGLLDLMEETFNNPPEMTLNIMPGYPVVTPAAWRQQHQIVFPPYWLPTANISATYRLNAQGGGRGRADDGTADESPGGLSFPLVGFESNGRRSGDAAHGGGRCGG